MFEQPVAPSGVPAFDNPNAEFRATNSESTTPSPDRSPETHSSPGEFTRLFQAITPDAPAKVTSPASSSRAVPAKSLSANAKPADAKPTNAPTGEFTRIFMRLPKDPGAEQSPATPIGAGLPSGVGNSTQSETGEFTRLMRAAELKSESPQPGPAPAAVPPSTPVRGFSTPGRNDAVSGTAGVTELFVAPTPGPPVEPARPAVASQGSVSPQTGAPFQGTPRPGPHSEQTAGEFTQLFRALDSRPESNPEEQAEIPASPAKPSDARAGEFTQLMQSLSPERAREALGGSSAQLGRDVAEPRAGVRPESTPPAMHPDDAASFTRILSTSAAREEAVRGMKPAADVQSAVASPARESAPVPSLAAMPGMPRLPQTPAIPRAVAFGQQPAAAAPTPPVLSSPVPAVPQTKLQAWLPLLLILNAFALAVLILLVIFALRRH